MPDPHLHAQLLRILHTARGSFDLFRAFHEVGAQGSYNAAAGPLGLANATSVRRVVERLRRLLRRELGIEVIASADTANGVRLTDPGRDVWRWVRERLRGEGDCPN